MERLLWNKQNNTTVVLEPFHDVLNFKPILWLGHHVTTIDFGLGNVRCVDFALGQNVLESLLVIHLGGNVGGQIASNCHLPLQASEDRWVFPCHLRARLPELDS